MPRGYYLRPESPDLEMRFLPSRQSLTRAKKLIRKDKIQAINVCGVGVLLATIAIMPYYTDYTDSLENIFPVFVVLLFSIFVSLSALICFVLGRAMYCQAKEREMKRAQDEDFNHEVNNLLTAPREKIT